MRVPQIISLCLSCFALGFNLCGMIALCIFNPRRRKAKPRKGGKGQSFAFEMGTAKAMIAWAREHPDDTPPWADDPTVHVPLLPAENESDEDFVQRVIDALKKGRLTPDAARMSFQMPPISRRGREGR